MRESRRAGGLWKLHVECRHEERLARLRHAGIRQGDHRQRPARAPLQHPVALLERHGVERRRRTGGLRSADVSLAGRSRPGQLHHPWVRLARRGTLRLLREVHPRCRDGPDDAGIPEAAGHGRGGAGPRRHNRGRPRRPLLRLQPHDGALRDRLLQADAVGLAQLRELARQRRGRDLRSGDEDLEAASRRLRGAAARPCHRRGARRFPER